MLCERTRGANCRLSDCPTVRQSDSRLSDSQTVRQSDSRTVGQSTVDKAIGQLIDGAGPSDRRTDRQQLAAAEKPSLGSQCDVTCLVCCALIWLFVVTGHESLRFNKTLFHGKQT